jgi:hypothetical protein
MRRNLILALVGCADSYNWTPQQNGSARIAASDRILISTPQDGEYGTHVYNGSGRNTDFPDDPALGRPSH